MDARPVHPVILLADDEVFVRNFLREALQRDYEMLVAADGREALQLSRAYDGVIHMLLSDVEMPRMDGVTLSRRIVAERSGVRVLLMSGSTERRLEHAGQPIPFLPKPFN